MASTNKTLGQETKTIPNCPNKKFGIVVSDYYSEITEALLDGAKQTLLDHEVKEENIFITYVPGTFEIPLGAVQLYKEKKCDGIIALGCVIKGETDHDVYINQAVANGIMNLSLTSGKPFVYGVLTPNTYQQAIDRAGGKAGNKGIEAAQTALRMVAATPNTTTKVGY